MGCWSTTLMVKTDRTGQSLDSGNAVSCRSAFLSTSKLTGSVYAVFFLPPWDLSQPSFRTNAIIQVSSYVGKHCYCFARAISLASKELRTYVVAQSSCWSWLSLELIG